MSITTATAKEQLAADFRNVMSDIEALMTASGNKAEGEVAALRTRIQDRLEAAKLRVSDLQHDAIAQARRAADATDSYVHDHPWQAIGLSAAVGVALGVLIARR